MSFRALLVLAAAAPSAALMPAATPSRSLVNRPQMLASNRRVGLKVAAGAALGNLLQGFNTGVIAVRPPLPYPAERARGHATPSCASEPVSTPHAHRRAPSSSSSPSLSCSAAPS